MGKPTYTKSSAELDAEARAKKDWQPDSVINHGVDPQKSDDGFTGNISPEYRNYADPKFAPLPAESGFEKPLEQAVLTDDADHKKGAPEEGEAPEEPDADEDEDKNKSSTQTPPTPPTP